MKVCAECRRTWSSAKVVECPACGASLTPKAPRPRRSGPDDQIEWDAACRLAAARGAVLLSRRVSDWWQRVDDAQLRTQGLGYILRTALGDRAVLAYVLLGGAQSTYTETPWMRRHGFALDPAFGAPNTAAGLDVLLQRWREAVDYHRRRAAHEAQAEALRAEVLQQIRGTAPRLVSGAPALLPEQREIAEAEMVRMGRGR